MIWGKQYGGMFEDLHETAQIDISEMNDGLDLLSDNS